MKQTKFRFAAVGLYALTAVLFTLFFFYLRFNVKIDLQESRSLSEYDTVIECSETVLEDDAAPAGVRREFQWTMDEFGEEEAVLVFYVVHHYVEVYFDDELVYSLMPAKTNRIGKSISSNWVVVPVYKSDIGKEVRVIATPVYEGFLHREIEFQIGPFYGFYRDQLRNSLPQLILSAACMFLGLFTMLVQLGMHIMKKMQKWDLFYLGNFTMLLGFWKITDTRFSPLLFENHTAILGYYTIGALFLISIPLGLFFSKRLEEYKTSPMLIFSIIGSLSALAALFCQVTGLADFREILTLSHVIIGLLAITYVLTTVIWRRKEKSERSKRSRNFAILLATGLFADMLSFYLDGNSSGLVYSMFAVLVYTMMYFVLSILDTNERAYTDVNTGLFNKRRWDVLMKGSQSMDRSSGIIMMDLNLLKYINDTMGHDVGDKLIFNFANILRNSIPASNTICRWGGDEFAVLLTNTSKKGMDQCVENIRKAVENYNASGEIPPISYALGYALASEFDEISGQKLFQKADERMYEDKKKWYRNHQISRS